MSPTAMDLLDAIRAHLAEFELPAPWSVTVTCSLAGPGVSAQLAGQEPPEIAAALLAWADTLDGVSAEAWRVPSGDSVHLSVTGRLPGGATLRVFDAAPFTQRGPGADLEPGTRCALRLGSLRHLATLGEVLA
ncbi:MAG: hypothetical protein ACRDTE_14860 [Pseudonocardiaceae bacterium]